MLVGSLLVALLGIKATTEAVMTRFCCAGNLPPEIQERELEEEFVKFGTLRNVWVRICAQRLLLLGSASIPRHAACV